MVTGQNSLSLRSKPLELLGLPLNNVLFSREFRKSQSFLVRWMCTICGHKLSKTTMFLAFPPAEGTSEGQWVHRTCADGNLERHFGVRRVVLMRGEDALRHLIRALDDASDPALARKQPRRPATVKAS